MSAHIIVLPLLKRGRLDSGKTGNRSDVYRTAMRALRCICGAPRDPALDSIVDGVVDHQLIAIGLCQAHTTEVYGSPRRRRNKAGRAAGRAAALKLLGQALAPGGAAQ